VSDEGAVLVTGASGGIGAEFVRRVADDGFDVVLTARREERLEEIADEVESEHGVSATVITKDLSEPDAAQELYEEVSDEGIEVHTLVNNAGFGAYGRFDETNGDAETDMIQVNVTALTDLTKLFLPEMVEREEGGVINLGSIASYYPTPRSTVYGASKAYVLSFSRALAQEFDDGDVTVTALCPGPVETGFLDEEMEGSGIGEGMTHTPDEVAEAGWKAYKKGKRVVLPSASMSLIAQASRFLPERIATKLGENAMEEGISFIP